MMTTEEWNDKPAGGESLVFSFMGFKVIIVEPGTVPCKGPDGEDLVVTDDIVAFKFGRMWVTPNVAERIRAEIRRESSDIP